MAQYPSNGSLTTDKLTIDDTGGFDSQSEWEAYQSASNVEIDSGAVRLAGALPDPNDLHSRYDWSVEDGSLPVTDQTGNGNDLGNGGYSGVGVDINGVQAGNFDGTDDQVNDTVNTIETPYHEFIVVMADSGASGYLTSVSDNTPSIRRGGGGGWLARPSDNDASVAGEGGDPIILEVLWGDTETTIYNVNTGMSGTVSESAPSTNTLYVGARGDVSLFIDADVGEHIRYGTDKSAVRGDVHRYLSDKWGIALP